MATLVLSAVGASVGSAIGGSVLGLGSAVVGRAVGATLGRVIDQRLLGSGADAVPTGRVERIHLNTASEGGAVGTSYGRIRLGGQVIWASRFNERVVTAGGSGKGTARTASSHYAYSVSLAIALGEGVVDRVGRIWADGVEIARDSLNWRLYPGNEAQLPDPKIEAVEGAGQAPAYRGTAYVVIEDLDLGPFGNRVPQFSFEVLRRARPGGATTDPAELIRGVALIPGTGEYALATTPVHFNDGPGANRAVNLHVPGGQTDFSASLSDLRQEAPKVGSVSVVVSWFGDDLRCGNCRVLPRVEQNAQDAANMAWEVSGSARAQAEVVSRDADGRPVFGGTPADASVIEAIRAIRAGGQEVMFYPFILMDIQKGNGLTDPWSGAADQPAIPWRGRITLSVAPGRDGSPDGTAAADAEVAAFFGQAAPGDFVPGGTGVAYTGPAEWSYRRMILHYAHLCALAGGVDSFCIGSELRGLTRIRGAGGFAVVAALRALAADVRAILGPDVRIGYAADWSEYFGYRPEDGSGDVYFNLDPLWADQNIDFIGIDNYMPLADWRDGEDHLDAEVADSIYDLDYLKSNVAGGEGFDWYYASDQAREFQIRTPIRDSAYGEDWVFRVKDLRSWWAQEHHERIGGLRQASPTPWVPESKPIWFTELGCAAIDKGANQPNAFWDAKSSESQLPYFSDGSRDDHMQAQYLRAMYGYWNDAANNPVSAVYGAPMVDMDHGHVWCWDARPWPAFPGRADVWSDGENYARGHWLNGRLGAQALADVVAEICMQAGVRALDVSGLHGVVRGYRRAGLDSARAALQPLMLAYGLDAVEDGGVMRFANRSGRAQHVLEAARLVWQGGEPRVEQQRAPEAEMAGKVQLNYLRADGAYEAGAAEAILPDEQARGVALSEMPLVLSRAEAQAVVERWLAEARTGRETLQLALPPSLGWLGAGDVVALPAEMGGGLARIDRIEDRGARHAVLQRVDAGAYRHRTVEIDAVQVQDFVPPLPVQPLFMDLPLITGNEVPEAPHLAVTATPWPGSVALYDAAQDAGYALNRLVDRRAVVGVTQSPLFRAVPGRWDNGAGVRVKLAAGSLSAAARDAVLNGANLAAIGSGDGDNWELFQFAEAAAVGPGEWELRRLLRGQAGSDGLIPDAWPVGSWFVLLDGAVAQIDLPPGLRNIARHYRIGPAQRPYDDASYLHEVLAFAGVGLKPYAPCHLRATRNAAGDLTLNWVRRTRIDGDNWDLPDVPLGEAFEAYVLRVMQAGALLLEASVGAPGWIYTAADQAADGVAPPFDIEVAQISERFGPGHFARILING